MLVRYCSLRGWESKKVILCQGLGRKWKNQSREQVRHSLHELFKSSFGQFCQLRLAQVHLQIANLRSDGWAFLEINKFARTNYDILLKSLHNFPLFLPFMYREGTISYFSFHVFLASLLIKCCFKTQAISQRFWSLVVAYNSFN